MSVRVVFLQSAEQDIRELRSYLIRHFGKDLAGELRQDQGIGRNAKGFSSLRHVACRA